MALVQVGRADFGQHHAEFIGEEARERHLQLRVGHEEDRTSFEPFALVCNRCPGAFLVGREQLGHPRSVDPERFGRRTNPVGSAFDAEGEQRIDPPRTALVEVLRRIAEKGLRQQVARIGSDARQVSHSALGQATDVGDAELAKEPPELVFDNVR